MSSKQIVILQALEHHLGRLNTAVILVMFPASSLINLLTAGQSAYVFGQVEEGSWSVGELADSMRGFISNLLKMIQMVTWKARAGVILVITFLVSHLFWRKMSRL